MDKSQLAALKTQHPKGKVITVGSGEDELEFFMKPCTRGDWLKYRAMSGDLDPAKRAVSSEFLATACAVEPNRNAIQDVFAENEPGIADALVPELRKLNRADVEVRVGD